MASISIVSMVLCFFLVIFSFVELVLLIRSINKKKGGKVLMHLMGLAATVLISYSVIKITFGAKLDSSTFVTATAVISVIFFIFCGFDTLFTVKSRKN